MAIFTPGPAVGQISGRVGGSVFSHNKGGAYIRNGSIPTIVQTTKALAYKAILTNMSRAFGNLTDAQRLAWVEYAANHPVVNALGRSHYLTALNWYIRCNSRLTRSGDAVIDVPPVIPGPTGAVITAADVDTTAGTSDITFIPTPIGANNKVWLRGCRVQSGTITNVRNKLTELLISAANLASPVDVNAEIVAELGTIQTGDWYHFELRVLDTTTGLMSGPSLFKTQAHA